jgi:hypothetical protein
MYARKMPPRGAGGKNNALRVVFGRRQDPQDLF